MIPRIAALLATFALLAGCEELGDFMSEPDSVFEAAVTPGAAPATFT